MKNFKVELILEPHLPKNKYNGRRYISIGVIAKNEIAAGKFAKETIEVLLIPNVLIKVNKIFRERELII